jgi:hypothetical protein
MLRLAQLKLHRGFIPGPIYSEHGFVARERDLRQQAGERPRHSEEMLSGECELESGSAWRHAIDMATGVAEYYAKWRQDELLTAC